MKWLILFSLLLSSSAFAISHKDFVKLPRPQREKIIAEYKKFLAEYSKTVEISSATPMNFPQFIESAYADAADCVYGGWPSTRVNGLCPLPRANPAFQRESCQQGQMPCQPLLFGRGVCVPNVTRQQKRSSFANCERRFEAMGKNLANVVEYISDPQVSQEADELFQLVDQICTSGAQASTPMCRNLKARVAQIRAERPAPAAQRQAAQRQADEGAARTRPAESRQDTEASSGFNLAEEAIRIQQTVRDLNTQARCETCEAQRAQTADEPQRLQRAQAQAEPLPQNNTPYPRITSGFDLAACGGTGTHQDGYDVKTIFDCHGNSTERTQAGYIFRPGPGHQYTNVQTRYPGGSAPGRFFEMASRNQAFNETYLVMEEYGGGPDSHNVKSYMFVIPRTTVPSVRVDGNNLVLTLPTGETVTMNKTSREIIGGALTEGPIDLNTDRFQRRPPNINYSGAGISIRLDHRYEHPLTSSQTAVVKQGTRTCNVPRTALFDAQGAMITTTDSDLLAVINRSCRGGGFRLP